MRMGIRRIYSRVKPPGPQGGSQFLKGHVISNSQGSNLHVSMLVVHDGLFMQKQTRPHYPQSTAHGYIERILAIFASLSKHKEPKVNET